MLKVDAWDMSADKLRKRGDNLTPYYKTATIMFNSIIL